MGICCTNATSCSGEISIYSLQTHALVCKSVFEYTFACMHSVYFKPTFIIMTTSIYLYR